jgi:uncharacterized protein YllA (UPF0747 family)
MKTKKDNKKEKTLIDQLRDIRDKVSLEIENMNSEQLKAYLKKKELLHPTSPWQKQG